MKTRIITIENWDGSKYDVEAPANAKYLGILSHTGDIKYYTRKPKQDKDMQGYYDMEFLIEEDINARCPRSENYPVEDGYGSSGTVVIDGIHMSELLLKIEEA